MVRVTLGGRNIEIAVFEHREGIQTAREFRVARCRRNHRARLLRLYQRDDLLVRQGFGALPQSFPTERLFPHRFDIRRRGRGGGDEETD